MTTPTNFRSHPLKLAERELRRPDKILDAFGPTRIKTVITVIAAVPRAADRQRGQASGRAELPMTMTVQATTSTNITPEGYVLRAGQRRGRCSAAHAMPHNA
jgi:hypothetical protein